MAVGGLEHFGRRLLRRQVPVVVRNGLGPVPSPVSGACECDAATPASNSIMSSSAKRVHRAGGRSCSTGELTPADNAAKLHACPADGALDAARCDCSTPHNSARSGTSSLLIGQTSGMPRNCRSSGGVTFRGEIPLSTGKAKARCRNRYPMPSVSSQFGKGQGFTLALVYSR